MSTTAPLMRPKRKRAIQTPPEQFAPGWIESLDHRTALAQSMRARFHAVASDLGGADQLSYARRSLIERFLWVEYWISAQERGLAQGEEFDVGKWVQAVNSLQGLVARIGIERRARDVSLADVLNSEAKA